jgi:hypothetical protein
MDRAGRDIGTQHAAQDVVLTAGGPSRDPHGLEADGDGVACEDLPYTCVRRTIECCVRHCPGYPRERRSMVCPK